MTRPIVLSNGSLHVGVNIFGMVQEFYYPYVGFENHVARPLHWRVGIWVEDIFSWLDDGNWEFQFAYEYDALVSKSTARHKTLDIIIEFQDCVASDANVFMRNIHVINELSRSREIKLFLHQAMRISDTLADDTVQYLPAELALMHYKGNRVFMVGASGRDGKSFDQHTVGTRGMKDDRSAYKDAEDGYLKGTSAAQGTVDSAMGFNLKIESHGSTRVSYWVAAGLDYAEAMRSFKKTRAEGVLRGISKTAQYWRHVLMPVEAFIEQVEPELGDSLWKSLLIVKAHIDKRGALIAATDTEMHGSSHESYAYCWPRDGALSLWPLLRLGYFDEVKNFFSFCRRALRPEGFLMPKYQPDGAVGSSHHSYITTSRTIPPIQEDETAIVLFLFGQYYQMTEDKNVLEEFYDSLIRPAANFMAGYIDEKTKLPHATYDLWEEKLLTTTYTTAVTYAALQAATRLAEVMGRSQDAVQWQTVADDMRAAAQSKLFNNEKGFFYKGFISQESPTGEKQLHYDDTIDISSFYGAFMFGLFDLHGEQLTQSYQTLQATFGLQENQVIALPCYEHDSYQDESTGQSTNNPRFITTLWLAQYCMETDRLEQASAIITWVAEHTLGTGVLTEQLDPEGQSLLSVTSSVWSQAELINSIIDLSLDPTKDTQ